jgi:hypothetical protein
MTIQFEAIEGTDSIQHAALVQAMLNDGWQRVGGHVTPCEDRTRIYTTFMQRGISDGIDTVNLASLNEVTRKHTAEIQRLKNRVKVVEDTLDDDSTADDEAGYPVNFVPMRNIHVIDNLTREDTVDEEIERELIARQILKDGKKS